MKKFIFEIFSFFFFGIPFLIIIFLFFNLNGYTDPFYLRFTSSEQTSLILGSSRAAQGIMPSVMNRKLKRNDLYNYSFTGVHSPYGETYLESIKKKCVPNSKGGLFIIEVDPWLIAGPANNPNDSLQFVELNLALAKTKIVNLKPNIFYLLNSYDNKLVTLFDKPSDSTIFLHNDGWLEVNAIMDSISVANRLATKIKEYRGNNMLKYRFSTLRLKYLLKTILYLQKHGKVYLVRLPIHSEMLAIENILMPDFDEKILDLAKKTSTQYMMLKDFRNDYEFVDGNHMYKTSSIKASDEISDWIIRLEKMYNESN